MNLTIDQVDLCLERRRSIHLRDAAGVRIVCRSGVLWITQHLDTRDLVLGAGESVTLDRLGVTVVHAAEAARIVLEESERQSGARAIWHGLRRLLGSAMSRIRSMGSGAAA